MYTKSYVIDFTNDASIDASVSEIKKDLACWLGNEMLIAKPDDRQGNVDFGGWMELSFVIAPAYFCQVCKVHGRGITTKKRLCNWCGLQCGDCCLSHECPGCGIATCVNCHRIEPSLHICRNSVVHDAQERGEKFASAMGHNSNIVRVYGRDGEVVGTYSSATHNLRKCHICERHFEPANIITPSCKMGVFLCYHCLKSRTDEVISILELMDANCGCEYTCREDGCECVCCKDGE